ncbi:hypothetical protein [Pseudomaricurvus alcaniphilus]|nr:hypothetical protein [Pseudomaricurvus alcaniphilus]
MIAPPARYLIQVNGLEEVGSVGESASGRSRVNATHATQKNS